MLCVECISIHALLAESDLEGRVSAVEGFLFLSTLSLRRATKILDDVTIEYQISIHALLAESDTAPEFPTLGPGEFLSTLSLRRATVIRHGIAGVSGHISIHALLAESDEARSSKAAAIWKFLSTLSLRRATALAHIRRFPFRYFYPRSPCGERPGVPAFLCCHF